MKTSTFFKIGFLVALSTCTWFITSSLVAGTPGQKKKNRAIVARAAVPQQQDVAPNSKHKETIDDAAIGGQSKKLDAYYQFTKLAVTAGRGNVTLDGSVEIMDSREDRKPMVWAVFVKDPATLRVIFKQIYDQQIFEVAAGEIERPTFRDTFPLAPGSYRVELRLYEVTPDIVPDALVQPQPTPHGGMLLSRFETVTVGE
jgi:hypothetical protein